MLDPNFLTTQAHLDFTNRENMTPFLVAAKFNKLDCMIYLAELGCNIFITDTKMQNPMHYAIINENDEMIKFLVSKDDNSKMRKDKNIFNKMPVELE